ncbi:leucine--tRNA ligase [Nonomuraea soli]|uniref:Leucine--tRNA ligase n=1 Tax=Nonomuraea soli TaxID=1032476 RepID=A0A7W0CGY7_9ACTN|nr:class I tRNA ligase family protein [Nonomuraea soli]MBA2890795.1 leucyl-tRNA synthetase [Nonomuraea soli]
MADTPHRYTAALAADLEARWQDEWEKLRVFDAPDLDERPKAFVMDMFPYPSGAGLHVGHPLGYIATDVYSRFLRMTGHNVLHTLGYDAFGLPAEQYAVETGIHPKVSTEANIETMRRQRRRLGLGQDDRRAISTIDPGYYRWTQWIFLKIFNSWYDHDAGRARPIEELVDELATGARATPDGAAWAELGEAARAEVLNGHRLAYLATAPVNWCPGLGTVLADEEVTADGRSERGNFPVFRTQLRQWMMRITAYADRLIDDLDLLDWPEPIKAQQRNWIGRSQGARIEFALPGTEERLAVFTTRPDTLPGVTFLALAPEHPLAARLAPASWPDGTPAAWTGGHASPAEAVAHSTSAAASRSDLERQAGGRAVSGAFTGAYVSHPADGRPLPVFVADYVLPSYGTGAVMGVPAHDERDERFALAFGLPVDTSPLSGDPWPLETRYKLRDWLFSRQRYWGEPFPVVYDADDVPHPLPESMLPVGLPDVDDYRPRTFDPYDRDSRPETPLTRSPEWVTVTLDLGQGPREYRRDVNTMPNWAGSCFYELRYVDPGNERRLVDPELERYWMGPGPERPAGGVDLYVGGAEHAVLHLLYARFWHKVLHDLGYVSSREPFHKLVNQGMIQAYVYRDSRGFAVPAAEVEERDGAYVYNGEPVTRTLGKMGKSLKNTVTPDEICDEYGADTLRLYEMSTGPLEAARPWETKAVVGSQRFLQRLWRIVVDEETGRATVADVAADEPTLRLLARTTAEVRADMEGLRFNTAIAKLISLTNHVTRSSGPTPRVVAESLTLLVAPLAPHIAEELWHRLGHEGSLAYEPYPTADPDLVAEETVTCVVQVNGRLRGRLTVPSAITAAELESLALGDPGVRAALGSRPVQRVVVRAPGLVNIVPAR